MAGHDEQDIKDTTETACCVVGGGPAGVVLSLLLARKGVNVTLLEAHKDFDRDFRGDTIHPSTLELMARLGLADRLHQMPHGKLRKGTFITPTEQVSFVDFSRLRTPYPYIMLMPQAEFLDLLAKEAAKYPSFRLVLGANVQRLVEEGGAVKGVRYQDESGWHEVRAALTVGADGRFSRLRKLAGFEPVKTAPPMDVVWFRLPRRPEDAGKALGGAFYIGHGHLGIVLERPNDEWQIGFVILKGGFGELKAQGLAALREAVARQVPPLADRVGHLQDFRQVTVLSVESSMCPVWHKPGLLLIGDAAHVMSPVGGIGIQYAVQDAVETANQLTAPLLAGRVTDEQLAAVQARRQPSARRAQKFQGFLQQRIVAQALNPDRPFKMPLLLRVVSKLPLLRGIPARLIGFGFGPSRLKE